MSRAALISAVMALVGLAGCGSPEPARTPPAASTTPPRVVTPSPTPTARPEPFALARSYEVSSPSELVDRLVRAERAIGSGDDRLEEAARIQQASYRQLVTKPEWRQEVFADVPDDLRDVVRANVEAGAELRALTQPRTELPPWTIVAPPPADELLGHYKAASKEFGIDWTYLAAIHLTETRMGRIRGDSHAGARGPMQFLPSTWDAYGEGDINDPRDAIMAAGRYLKAHGAPGNMPRALFAYNHSDHYVRAITLHAQLMRDSTAAYHAYHQWQVYYRTTKGDALLYEGWPTK